MLIIKPQAINLLRYLLVLRVTDSMVTLPSCLPLEMSYVLGTMITERMPTGRIKAWRKMQMAWEEDIAKQKKGERWPLRPVDVAWPLESVWLSYAPKMAYGQDELIVVELKLLGQSALHPLFLELVLPVLEEAGVRADSRWKRPRSLWGRFNVQEVYVARGAKWEPVVADGRLDFTYRPTPEQWAEGLTFGEGLGVSATKLEWLTPFEPLTRKRPLGRNRDRLSIARYNSPTVAELLLALTARLDEVAPGWIAADERETAVANLITPATEITHQAQRVESTPKEMPGFVRGSQKFRSIPPSLLPNLELASILHVGRQTHFGCGTFRLT